jgi:hypothetical protein
MKSIKILMYFAAWGRPDILRVCIAGVKALANYKPELYQIIPFVVCSTQEDKDILDSEEILNVFHPNQPLGRKKNYGLYKALETVSFDYMLEIGSDDLIAPEYLDLCLPYLQEGVEMISSNNCYFLDSTTGKVAFWHSDIIIGAGRFIHANVLKRMQKISFQWAVSACGPDLDVYPSQITHITEAAAKNYEAIGFGKRVASEEFVLWKPSLARGLDTNSYWNVMLSGKVRHIRVNPVKPLIIDIKSENNINPFSAFVPFELTPEELMNPYPQDVKDSVYSLLGIVEKKKNKKKK